jgi:hypothetical protein
VVPGAERNAYRQAAAAAAAASRSARERGIFAPVTPPASR